MAYQDWEKYHNKKSSSGAKKTTAKSQSAKSRTTKTKSKTTTRKKTTSSKSKAKRKVVNRKKKFKPTPKNTLLMLLIGTSLAGVMYAGANEMQLGVGAESLKPTYGISAQGELGEVKEPSSNEDNDYSEQELLDYKEYCYIGNYGDNKYLFCPEEYVLALAEHSIDKLNALYKSSGEMPILENGECIPSCITPELVSAICFTESSYRVESASGRPLGIDRDCPASDRAEGILQQKPDFVTDADRYSRMYGGEGYSLDDRYNPLKAMEICVSNLTRIYRAYLQKGCDTYSNLGARSSDDEVLLGALIVAYNQGEGAMQKWARNGNLSYALANPNSTDKYGLDYYKMVMENLEDILEEDYAK